MLTNVIMDFQNLVYRFINIFVPGVIFKNWVLQEFLKKSNGFCIVYSAWALSLEPSSV